MNSKNSSNDQLQDYLGQSSQEHEIRVQKIENMRKIGIEPWPVVKLGSSYTSSLISQFKENDETVYSLSGRVISIRLHGKAAFVHLQDSSGRLQLYIKQDIIGYDEFEHFEQFIDIGDIIWVQGTLFKTKLGEITLRVKTYSLQSKCLHPLPEKFHGLHDIELRYRQRYLDLISNQESKTVLLRRSLIVQACREFLTQHEYLEVETPMLHPIPGGAAARPFKTHHNTLGQDFYLRIAPELYLKRLVVGGFDRVFEINRNFRNEGISTKHNPEFSMLEFYTAYQDYHYAMNFIEEMIRSILRKVGISGSVSFGEHMLHFDKPFAKINLYDAVKKYHALQDSDLTDEKIDALLKKYKIVAIKANMTLPEKMYLLFEETIESQLIQPTFVIGFPIEVSPLAKRDEKNHALAARAELFVAGLELANLFNELNDPFEQAKRFHEQVLAKQAGDVEAHQYDADFILSLEYGLPPTVGVGIGIDRLVMLLTGTTSIKDVILFPTLKKK
ncbi:lysine--tRNA ligase [Candidatus Dependentiae bacterium]|nr:lysine--tRNA ligase [Candidatus Dependentiae bacterium]